MDNQTGFETYHLVTQLLKKNKLLTVLKVY